jgi:hypothetical protein
VPATVFWNGAVAGPPCRPHGDLAWQVLCHDFGAERGGADYGSELDLALTSPLPFGVGGKLEYADYEADGFAADTRKLWLTLQRNG